MKIIGIAGKKRSGKDTAAKIIKDIIGPACQILHFADALKEEVADVCLVSLKEIEENKELFRPMLQWWGTEFRRKYQKDETYWIEQLDQKIIPDWVNIIADVRFPEEAEYIKRNGGVLIRVDRYGGIGPKDSHLSETALDHYTELDFDHVITASSLDSLEQQTKIVTELLESYLTSHD